MPPLISQLAAVVLTVDIHQKRAKLLELHRADRDAAHAAGALSVRADPALDDQLLVAVDVILPQKSLGLACHIEACAHQRLVSPAAHQFPTDAITQHGADGVDHDGLTGARLAGQNVEPRVESDVRAFNNGDIFNVKFVQHSLTPRCASITFLR